MDRKIRPLCGTPRNGVFCGPDKYLKLQELTISEELYPVMEFDSYFIYVRDGRGTFIINGDEFPVEKGSVAWIQCTHVLTICPDFAQELHIWVCTYDYQLLSYFNFDKNLYKNDLLIINGSPVIFPRGKDAEMFARLFEQYYQLNKMKNRGSAVIRSSFLRKIEILYSRLACNDEYAPQIENASLGRRACMYIASHCKANISALSVVNAIAPDLSESVLNHALLVTTGLSFNQYLTRLRLALAMSYFLYDSLSFDYISSISGFNMEITFFRRFKAVLGVTPQVYVDSMISDGKDGRVYRNMIMSEILISAISYLYENMTDFIDAETIAKALYTSENIMRVQFRSRLNTSYKAILSHFRVRYAESLLATTTLPTVDIAVESGFGSVRTMNRVFYSINNISPGEFRKLRRQRSISNG